MLPTTRAKTSKTSQKRALAKYEQEQKTELFRTVTGAIDEYSATTGKDRKKAQQELFTIEHLSRRKRNLCARDIFMKDKMKEVNKGMHSDSIYVVLGYP